MIKITSFLKLRKNGEGNDPAKIAENATALLTSYGHTAEEIAELATADAGKIGAMFTSRREVLEQEIIARKGKELSSAAELNGKKFAYKNSEDRLRATALELGITLTDEDLTPLEEKTRLEGILKLVTERVKASVPASKETPEAIKEWQAKYEGALQGQTAAQKAAKDREKELSELKASIPVLQEKMQSDFFIEQTWRTVALNKSVVENLTINDDGVLSNIVTGHMATNGHKFSAEKTAEGKLRLSVVNREGQPIQMANSMGNHTPESYIQEIYAPLTKKSNGNGNISGATFSAKLSDELMKNMTPEMAHAMKKMNEQAQSVTGN
jgi:hypothetical protein